MNANIQEMTMDCTNALPLTSTFNAFIERSETVGGQLCYYLRGGSLAYTAESLLLTPEEGDLVLCVKADNHLFITQLLRRNQPTDQLRIISTRPVDWVAPSIRFKALNEMELMAVERVTIAAKNIVHHAAEALVQQAYTLLQSAKALSINAKGLMQLKGRQQLITAEEDLRMDAKRINMG